MAEKTKPFHSVRMKRLEKMVPRKGLVSIATASNSWSYRGDVRA